MSRCLFEIADGAGYTCVVEPGLAVAQIQLAQGSREPLLQQRLAEVLSLGQIRHIGIALQPLPAHHLELCAEGLLDEVVFPLDLAHGVQGWARFSVGSTAGGMAAMCLSLCTRQAPCTRAEAAIRESAMGSLRGTLSTNWSEALATASSTG